MIADLEKDIASLETQVAEARNKPQIGDIADECFRLWEEHKRLKAANDPGLQALRLRMQAHIRMLLSRIVLTDERIHIVGSTNANGHVYPSKTLVRMDVYGPLIDARKVGFHDFEFSEDGLGAWCYYDTKPGEKLKVERRNTKKRKSPTF
jgi:hypothetical protein